MREGHVHDRSRNVVVDLRSNFLAPEQYLRSTWPNLANVLAPNDFAPTFCGLEAPARSCADPNATGIDLWKALSGPQSLLDHAQGIQSH